MKKKRNIFFGKKSQVALEFLVTYGWAILASMIAIAALAYFGITNPAKTLPDKCIFSNNFVCSDYIINSPNTVKVKLINGLGQSLYLPNASVINSSGVSSLCTLDASAWASDESREMNCTISGGNFLNKEKTKIKFSMTYRKTASGYDQLAVGELYATVQ
jgi:hypothetical protein